MLATLHVVLALAPCDAACGRAGAGMPLGTFLPHLIMEKQIFTSQVSRLPTEAELTELQTLIESEGSEPAFVLDAYIAVYDRYITGSPGYIGKLMTVVWDAGPSFYDVFVWQDGKIERCGREFDDRECSRCGAANGTLCFNCWRTSKV